MSFCRAAHNAVRWRIGKASSPIFTATVQLGARRLSTVPLYEASRRNTPLLFQHSRRNFWSSTPSAPTPTPTPTPTSITPPLSTPPLSLTPSPFAEETSDIAVQTVSSDSSSVADSVVSALADPSSIAYLPPPLQIGDLHALGQANLWPPGLVQRGLEFINVTTGLPWWGTIVVAAVLVRAVGFYFTVNTARASANLLLVKPELTKLNEEMMEAYTNGEVVKQRTLAVKIKQMQKDSGVGPLKLLPGPFYQLFSNIFFFLAVNRLCALPLVQLQHSGFYWIPDLTSADPTYILPLLVSAGMIIQSRLGRADAAASGSEVGKHIANVVPVLAVVSFAIFHSLPAALMLYFATNIGWGILQAAVLRQPGIRTALNLPPLPEVTSADYPSMQDTWNAVKEHFREQQRKAELLQKKRAGSSAFALPEKHIPKDKEDK
ncbi:hypothetical protein M422DRAFT_199201 [Sphaerobolus stellatus SS14]|nr:hypothetical protein M422DRAFT_199201 [Sphaerobolus stellatus SS14]